MSSAKIDLNCWKCGHQLQGIILPLSRLEECPKCSSDLHACKTCKHFSTSAADNCLEDRAETIFEKDKANFCDYLLINQNAYSGSYSNDSEIAKAKLAELFGDNLVGDTNVDQGKSCESEKESDADKALLELKRLFGDD